MMDPYQRNGVTAMRHDFLATLQEKAQQSREKILEKRNNEEPNNNK
jgi:hypothetical protein